MSTVVVIHWLCAMIVIWGHWVKLLKSWRSKNAVAVIKRKKKRPQAFEVATSRLDLYKGKSAAASLHLRWRSNSHIFVSLNQVAMINFKENTQCCMKRLQRNFQVVRSCLYSVVCRFFACCARGGGGRWELLAAGVKVTSRSSSFSALWRQPPWWTDDPAAPPQDKDGWKL